MKVPVFICPKCGVEKVFGWDKDFSYPIYTKDIDHLSCLSCNFKLRIGHIELNSN